MKASDARLTGRQAVCRFFSGCPAKGDGLIAKLVNLPAVDAFLCKTPLTSQSCLKACHNK